MTKNNFTLQWKQNPHFLLRTINEGDLENLRKWKNTHKQSFFHQEDITPEQQQNWFINYSIRPHDYMLVVEQTQNSQAIGCMGFRHLPKENTIDVYNIMRGEEGGSKLFSMSDAFQTMNSYLAQNNTTNISCKVLNANKALTWYYNNFFEKAEQLQEYQLLVLNKEKQPIKEILQQQQ
jgi:hypothetical protein